MGCKSGLNYSNIISVDKKEEGEEEEQQPEIPFDNLTETCQRKSSIL